MWPLDDPSAKLAAWITGILGGLAIAGKIFFRVRRDAREDRAGGATSEGYELIIAGLRAEITRLHVSLDDLARRMNAEIAVRREMESELTALRMRADRAEARAEQSAAREHAAEEVVLIFKTRIAALEVHIQRLEQGRAAGEMP